MRTAIPSKQRKLLIPGISFLTVFAVLFILLKVKGYAPFGELSLAWADGDYQYLDFFAYLKRCLAGEDSLLYSYYKGMGSNSIGLLGTYLSSPVNLLVTLFDFTELPVFFDIAVCIKLSLAGCFLAVFLENRLEKELKENGAGHFYVWALSVCYALCQYCMAQNSNIMWMDGVYMLPLMLLGVYEAANDLPGKWKLSVFVGLAILFNWYSAAMNCFFTMVWFVAEYFLRENREKKGFVYFLRRCLDYVIYMALGVMLSMALFLPMVLSMADGSRGGIRWELLTTFAFRNPFPSIVSLYRPGQTSSKWAVSLYCGILPILGVLGAFVTRKRSLRQKLVYAGLLVFMCLMFYSYPLIGIFSLIRLVGSYWYRYSYFGCYILIFIASEYLIRIQPKNIKFFRAFSIISAAICILSVADMTNNARLLMDNYHLTNGLSYGEYYTDGVRQIENIRRTDDGLYRITQTENRGVDSVPVMNNEGAAMGYLSVHSYSSTPAARQVALLNALGYRSIEDSQNRTVDPLIASDALLGAKYLLSQNAYEGFEKVEGQDTLNGKDTYLNPFALPFAFTYTKGDPAASTDSRFLYVNRLYSELCGEKVKIFESLNWDRHMEDGSVSYTMGLPEGNYVFYGNIPFYGDVFGNLDINGKRTIAYSAYLDPSVFIIQADEGETRATVRLTCDQLGALNQGSEEFYALNLDALKDVTDRLKAGGVSDVILENKKVTVNVNNTNGDDRLYISLPYDPNWKVYRNGEEINVFLAGDCMYSLPMVSGENCFEFRYSMPSLWAGFGISLIALAILIVLKKRARVVKQSTGTPQ